MLEEWEADRIALQQLQVLKVTFVSAIMSQFDPWKKLAFEWKIVDFQIIVRVSFC